MKRKHILVLFSIMFASLLTGCSPFIINEYSYTSYLDKEFRTGNYVTKIDNFFIILDSSSSMSTMYEGKSITAQPRFAAAQDMIKQMLHIMPEIKAKGALQIFGHESSEPGMQTETVYGLTDYSRSEMAKRLDGLKLPEGNSPTGLAIDAVSDILQTTSGRTAVILISDGEYLENNPRVKIRALSERYKDNICFYPIWIGNKPESKMLMEELAAEMECGFYSSFDEIIHKEGMIDFIIKVFFLHDTDRDNDGVPNDIDRCPHTPENIMVDEFGCPKMKIDSDNDGVTDDHDKCPDTPIDVAVDEFGCPVSRIDSDHDGVTDDHDKCPDTPAGIAVDKSGCPEVKIDSDNDGVTDGHDKCPDTPIGVAVDEYGCPDIRIDSDHDGITDDIDKCPDTPAGIAVDKSGCPVVRVDSDNDGVTDDLDKCPDTPTGVVVDEFGCPEIKIDSDNDGVTDDHDKCPDTPIGVAVDEVGCPLSKIDSDNDGVTDDHDKCPDTPAGVVVDESGCPKFDRTDSDNDGIYDYVDECPDTPKGALVDSRGCWIVRGVKFEYKRWNIQPQYNSNLKNIVKIMNENPELKIKIEGHTDDIGSMEYNLNLSKKRAQAIVNYLIQEGIDQSRMSSVGLGYSQPIANNNTAEGRALNRRAEIIPIK